MEGATGEPVESKTSVGGGVEGKIGGEGVKEREAQPESAERGEFRQANLTDDENEIAVEDAKELSGAVRSTREAGGFSILTWNVWFGDRYESAEHFRKRCQGIVDYLGGLRPDFVCLQEVTPSLLKQIQSSEWVEQEYDVSNNSIRSYGVLLLSRKGLSCTFKEVPLPTNQGRSLLCAEAKLKSGEKVAIATVHLESLHAPRMRRRQLAICDRALSRGPDTRVLCGDFNFCSYRNFNPEITPLENLVLREEIPEFVDVWTRLLGGGKQKGYTFDSVVNTNIHKFERMRYDRTLARSASFAPRRISMIGTIKVDLKLPEPEEKLVPVLKNKKRVKRLSTDYGAEVHLSDHFGLISFFTPLADGEPAVTTGRRSARKGETCSQS